jgi:hypothetical protein
LYVRFGYLPEHGFSFNKLNRHFEAGVSCFDVNSVRGDLIEILVPDFSIEKTQEEVLNFPGYRELARSARGVERRDDLIALAANTANAMLNRPAFLVAGQEAKWRGSGGEPCVLGSLAMASLDKVSIEGASGLFRVSDRFIPWDFYSGLEYRSCPRTDEHKVLSVKKVKQNCAADQPP